MPLFKLCPAKFENQKEETYEEETYLKCYNSNSSISSGHSTNEDNTSNNHVLLEEDDHNHPDDVDDDEEFDLSQQQLQRQQQQNDFLLLNKFQATLKEKILKCEDAHALSSSDESGVNKPDENLIILEICADCYQMMDGVKVNDQSKNTTQLAQTRPVAQQSRKKLERTNSSSSSSTTSSNSSSKINCEQFPKKEQKNNFIKSIYLSKNREIPSSCSSDAIVMNSLSNVNIVNSAPDTLNENDSPLISKKSFNQHSTPSTSSSNLGVVINAQESELSTIALNDEENSFSKKTQTISKAFRQNLTLNLQPVYTSSNSSLQNAVK